jgi:uncharacterized protein (DUF2141 family)
MAQRSILILAGILFLASCAQIGILSGGDRDEIAPVPVLITPDQQQTNFTGTSVSFTFDEFVQLNNPQQNIVMIPGGVKTTAVLKKKSMTVSWSENLIPNTTYVIYMNGVVKDITEGNDSLMSYVFSTGSVIDSLSYEATVTDAWTGQALKNMLVGLYVSEEDKLPLYFTRTDAFGSARFTNLKSGTYRMRCFADEDKDLISNAIEKRGFKTDLIKIDSNIVDSIPVAVYSPLLQKVRSFSFSGPGIFSVGAGFSLENATIKFNGNSLNEKELRRISSDSLLIFPALSDTTNNAQLIVSHQFGSDTLNVLLNKKDKTLPLKLKSASKSNSFGPHQEIIFELNDQITTIDSSKIRLLNSVDSSLITLSSMSFDGNILRIFPDRTQIKEAILEFDKGAVQGRSGNITEKENFTIQFKTKKDFGDLTVKVAPPAENLLVELINGGQTVTRSKIVDSSVVFSFLEPGEYTFRVIVDNNENGRWDTGNESALVQPEKILNFSAPVKVRANWEAQIELNTQD